MFPCRRVPTDAVPAERRQLHTVPRAPALVYRPARRQQRLPLQAQHPVLHQLLPGDRNVQHCSSNIQQKWGRLILPL